jgi:hypothetical protein
MMVFAPGGMLYWRLTPVGRETDHPESIEAWGEGRG